MRSHSFSRIISWEFIILDFLFDGISSFERIHQYKYCGRAMEREICAKIIAVTRDFWRVHLAFGGSQNSIFCAREWGILFRVLATEAWLVCRKVGNVTTKLSHAMVELLMNLEKNHLHSDEIAFLLTVRPTDNKTAY